MGGERELAPESSDAALTASIGIRGACAELLESVHESDAAATAVNTRSGEHVSKHAAFPAWPTTTATAPIHATPATGIWSAGGITKQSLPASA